MPTTPDTPDRRDVFHRNSPDVCTPGEDLRYLVTRAGTVAVTDSSEPGAALALAWDRTDPRHGRALDLTYLGRRGDTRLVAVEFPDTSALLDDPGRDMRDLRRVGALLSDDEAGLAMTAVAMGAWHRSTRFCPQCGAKLVSTTGGWVLSCTEDGSEHFPRTDPAVIMSLIDEEGNLLLAHNARAPKGFYSVLAGFVEPGESVEEAVVRESYEESGLVVHDLTYVASQPWPFPRSLMLGYSARVTGVRPLIQLLDGELGAARWFNQTELRESIEAGNMTLPGPLSLGYALIQRWYGKELPSRRGGRDLR